MLRRDKAPFDLPPVAEVSWPMALSFGDPTQITAKLEWFEKGKPQSADLLVTI